MVKRSKNIIFSCILLLTALFRASYAQEVPKQWPHIRSVKTPKVHKVSIDRHDFLYIADDRGNVHKYDTIGNLLLTYSPRQNNEVSILEAWRKVNILVFNRNFQEYVILDRFLTQSPIYRLRAEQIGFARLLTYAADNNLWIVDEKDFSLKKFNLRFNKVEVLTPLDFILNPSKYEMTFIREYQNLLFISDRNSGILVFDNLGNFKTKLPFLNVQYFSFRGDELYFIANDRLTIYNLYSKKEVVLDLPTQFKFNYMLLIKDKAYGFTATGMEVFALPK
ncbi:MAG: hypothetical protein ACK4ND_06220 [Cytophagaceae bacterium]